MARSGEKLERVWAMFYISICTILLGPGPRPIGLASSLLRKKNRSLSTVQYTRKPSFFISLRMRTYSSFHDCRRTSDIV